IPDRTMCGMQRFETSVLEKCFTAIGAIAGEIGTQCPVPGGTIQESVEQSVKHCLLGRRGCRPVDKVARCRRTIGCLKSRAGHRLRYEIRTEHEGRCSMQRIVKQPA